MEGKSNDVSHKSESFIEDLLASELYFALFTILVYFSSSLDVNEAKMFHLYLFQLNIESFSLSNGA